MSSYDSLSETQQFACRVVADHARSTAFSIADGILPGNEGRNYVLRKIMRRAIYHGREHLGLKDLFFYKVCDFVIDQMHSAYPELEAQREFIGKMVRLEEERFGNTVTVGLKKLDELGLSSETLFSDIAKLYDTYGTPRDLIRVYLEEKGITFEEDDFNSRFDEALQAAQRQSGIGHTERKSEISPIYAEMLDKVGPGKFHGYDATRLEETEVVGIVKGDSEIDSLNAGDEGLIVLKETPYYAEAGGQVGDTGILVGTGNRAGGSADTDADTVTKINVVDTFSPVSGLILHKSKVESGAIKVGDKVTALVDSDKRDATRRNHTATHLVHAALREVLGTHVKQAGSVVAPNYLRFDFTHYQPMTEEQIVEIEDLVNRYILENQPVTTNVMAIEEAMSGGAMALFGEKYGSDVRVLSVGDGVFSKELCGGTHVRATGDIGSFKITADEAIASGVRRIRAITGFDAFERFREDERLIDRSLGALKTQRDNLPNAIERLQEELKRTRKEMDDLKLKIATGAIGNASSNGDEARDVNGVKVLGKIVDGLDGNGARQLSDTLLARLKSGVIVLGREADGKVSIIVRVSDDLTGKVKAGNVIKEIVPIVGGKGGGRPDMAEGGGTEPAKLSEAIDASYAVIEKMLA
ncbi:MAG TPA: alanine--tRNA ligase [Pyrinomonadaceae bacterium]|nr:alanine--tRNA ligase [Pyrinomonadaceae bacterium]